MNEKAFGNLMTTVEWADIKRELETTFSKGDLLVRKAGLLWKRLLQVHLFDTYQYYGFEGDNIRVFTASGQLGLEILDCAPELLVSAEVLVEEEDLILFMATVILAMLGETV